MGFLVGVNRSQRGYIIFICVEYMFDIIIIEVYQAIYDILVFVQQCIGVVIGEGVCGVIQKNYLICFVNEFYVYCEVLFINVVYLGYGNVVGGKYIWYCFFMKLCIFVCIGNSKLVVMQGIIVE